MCYLKFKRKLLHGFRNKFYRFVYCHILMTHWRHFNNLYFLRKKIILFENVLPTYQGVRVVKELDLSSNVQMHAWVRTPSLVILFGGMWCSSILNNSDVCLMPGSKLPYDHEKKLGKKFPCVRGLVKIVMLNYVCLLGFCTLNCMLLTSRREQLIIS